jgi:hypothetical protein
MQGKRLQYLHPSSVYPSNNFLCLRTNVVLTVPHTQSPFHHHVCGWFPHDPQDSPLPAVGYHLSWGMGIMPPLGLTWHMVMRKDLYIYIPLVKGSLARKLPSYGRLAWSALASPSSCQSSIIKSLGSATIRVRVSSRVKTISSAKPCVFSGKVAVRGRRRMVSVSAVSRLDRGKWSTNGPRDCSESSISHKNCAERRRRKCWAHSRCVFAWRFWLQSFCQRPKRLQTFLDSFFHFFILSFIHSFIHSIPFHSILFHFMSFHVISFIHSIMC